MLPRVLVDPLKEQIERARVVHEEDLRMGFGGSVAARCAVTEIAVGRAGVELAVDCSSEFALEGQGDRAAPSPARKRGAEGGAERRRTGQELRSG